MNFLWRFFSSVKFTVVILILLAVASIIGTLIPQIPQREITGFAGGLSPGIRKLFFMLGFFDLYHALWFRLLLTLLTLNLVVCSLERFPGAWKRFRFSPRVDRDKPFEDLPVEQTFVVQENMEGAVDRVQKVMKKTYGQPRHKNSRNRSYVYGEKGAFAHFGVYLVHLSVLIILVGGLVGSFLGFEASVMILEGETADTVTLRKQNRPLGLGFNIRCDRLFVDYYENGAPKEYRSDITFFKDGKEAKKTSIRVNHPAIFEGVTLYLSTIGSVPGGRVRLRVAQKPGAAAASRFELQKGTEQPLPGDDGFFRILKVSSDFMGRLGPAVKIAVRNGKEQETEFWVFQERDMIQKRFPGLMAQDPRLNASAFEPYTFYLEGMERLSYTGLQVNRDPGVPIVWTGCFLMVAGFFVTFFMSHRRIWIRLSSIRKGVRVEVAGTATKNPVGFQREMERLTASLKNSIPLQD